MQTTLENDKHTTPAERQKPIGQLLGDLKDDCVALVRTETRLAKEEVRQNAARAGKLTAIIGGGAALAFSGLVVSAIAVGLFVGLAFGATGITAAASGLLLVGLTFLAVGGATAYFASRELPEKALVPKATLNSLRRDLDSIKNHLS